MYEPEQEEGFLSDDENDDDAADDAAEARAEKRLRRAAKHRDIFIKVGTVLGEAVARGPLWSGIAKARGKRERVQDVLRPAVRAIEAAAGGTPVGEIMAIGSSERRSAKTHAAAVKRAKQEGHREYLEAVERDRAERSAIASFGLGVAIRRLKELQRSESLEDRDAARARGGPKRTKKRARSLAKSTTWLLAARAREGYAEAVGVGEEAHRAMTADAGSEYTDAKMAYYLRLVTEEIAANVGVAGMPVTELAEVLACDAEALRDDARHKPMVMYHIDYTAIANTLQVARGGEGRSLHAGDGGQVIKDIMRDGGLPLACFVPKRKQAANGRQVRRGYKQFALAGGRTERTLRPVRDAERAASLQKLIDDGELDMGYSKPPRVSVVVREENGDERAEHRGDNSQILPVRRRLGARLKRMAHLRLLRWRPPFFEAAALPFDEVRRLLVEERANPSPLLKDMVDDLAKPPEDHEEQEAVRERLCNVWEINRSARSQPAPRGDAPPCGVFCDECATVVCCSKCKYSVAAFACTCGEAHVLACWRCARLGANDNANVMTALMPHGLDWSLMDRCLTRDEKLLRLVRLERMHEVSELLVELGQDAWLEGEGEAPHFPIRMIGGVSHTDVHDRAREARLLAVQSSPQLAAWVDNSPIINKGWMLAMNQILYDPAKFMHGVRAEKECRRPMLHHLAQTGDALEEVKYAAGLRLEDWHTMNAPLRGPWGEEVGAWQTGGGDGDGRRRIGAPLRFLLGDLPELQKNSGVSNGGEQGCPGCIGKLSNHTNLVDMQCAPLRDWVKPVELARKVAALDIPAFALRFGPNAGCAGDIIELVHALGGSAKATRAENEPLLRDILQGYTNAPAFYGSNLEAREEVHAICTLTPYPDYPLHVFKGLLAYLFETYSAYLKPELRSVLEERLDELHKGGATVKSGFHRRLELAHAPWLLRAPLRAPLGELAEAMDCLALVMAWGVRVPHVRWHAYRHHCVLITNVCLFKFAVLLLRCIPVVKKKRGVGGAEKQRVLYGMFFHQLVAHLGSDVKYVCPMHAMTEWFEMLWGPLRHLTLATSSRDTKHALLNMVRRLQVTELWTRLHGERAELASASHAALATGFEEHYGAMQRARIELDERFTGSEHFPALIATVPEYLETNLWHHIETRGSSRVLVFHSGPEDTNHAQPKRQHFRNADAASM